MKLVAFRGFCEGAVAKIWKIEEKAAGDKKWKVLQLSVSESFPNPQEPGKYINKTTFSGYVNYNGPLKAETLNGATVVCRGVSATTSLVDAKDGSVKADGTPKKVSFTNFAVSDLILMRKGDANAQAGAPVETAPAVDAEVPGVDDVPVADLGDEEFPF